MLTLHISLPDRMKEFVEAQIDSGRYDSASEYVRELIRDDVRRREQPTIGPADELPVLDWKEIRSEAAKPFGDRKARSASGGAADESQRGKACSER